jgi:hypothetical protein
MESYLLLYNSVSLPIFLFDIASVTVTDIVTGNGYDIVTDTYTDTDTDTDTLTDTLTETLTETLNDTLTDTDGP